MADHDHDHSHAHSHDHDHSHSHDHDHAHSHDHDHAHDHDGEADGPSPLNASVTVADAGPARKKLSIEIPAESIAARLSENFDSLQEEAAISGFRPGRAPMRLLEKRFGKDVRKEVRNQIVGESYTSAVEDHELRVLGQPNIKHLDELELPESGPLSFEIEIEVVPEVVLPELTGMAVTKTKYAVADEQIDAELSRYGEMYGSFKGVDEAKLNDYITANVSVRAADGDEKGEVLHEATSVQMLVPGEARKGKGVVAGMVIEDLGDKLEGAKPGETVTIETTGPERHENEKLIGRAVAIDVSVSKIERMHPLAPKELAESMGMESVDELREQVKASLTSRVESRQQQEMAQQIAEKLLESVEVELPERVSAHQAGRILQRKATEMMYRGASQQEIEDQLAELRTASEAEAQKELKVLFVLDKVARELGVDVTEEEVNGRIYQIAMQRGERPDRVRDQLIRSGQADQLFVQLREEKAVAKILESATITEVEPSDEPDSGKKSGKKAGGSGGTKKKAEKAEAADDDDDDDAGESKPKKKTTKKSASKKKDD